MVYTLDQSRAKFASAQGGLRRRIGLMPRLYVKHAVNAARDPTRFVKRAIANARHRADFDVFRNQQFRVEGCLNTSEAMGCKIRAFVERWRPRCDERLSTLGDKCPKIPFKLEQLLDCETIRSLIFDRYIVGSIGSYLGEAPIFATATLWIGQKERRFAGSPFYHLDSCGWGAAKFYVYLSDVGPGSGPFAYIPRSDSESYTRATGYLGDAISDSDISAFFKSDPTVSVTGPSGTGFLVDPTRCLHYGSRCTEAHRYSLIISYQRWTAPNSEVGRGPAYLESKGYLPDDPLARLLIAP